jgi:hypothetical protein
MVIEYSNKKEIKCYRDYVLNPSDRQASRAFSKTFGVNLMEPAKKLHDRLVQYASVGAYNAKYGSTDNRIELKQGCADKDPLILKVRISQDMRKFFNQQIDGLGTPLLKKNWDGDFNSITTVCVVAINKHNYNI